MNADKLYRENVVCDDGSLKFYENISLQNIASVNIAVHMCRNLKVFLPQLSSFRCFESDKIIKEFLKLLLAKTLQLPLPQKFVHQIAILGGFIGTELIHWIRHHAVNYSYIGKYLDCKKSEKDILHILINNIHLIKWTNGGKINLEQTAKFFVNETNLDLEDEYKYIFACEYCLKEELQNFPKEMIRKYCDALVNEKIFIKDSLMVFYWTYRLTNCNDQLRNLITVDYTAMSFHEYLFSSLLNSIVGFYDDQYFDVSKKYLWNKLTDIEKSNQMTSLVTSYSASNYIYLLLSSLESEQQKQFFQSCKISKNILVGMLNDWEWLDCLLPTIFHIIEFLDPNAYVCVLNRLYFHINWRLKEGVRVYEVECFKAIFKTLWDDTPNQYREYYLRNANIRVPKQFFDMLGIDFSPLAMNYLTSYY